MQGTHVRSVPFGGEVAVRESPTAEVGRDRVRTSDRGVIIKIRVKIVSAFRQDVVPRVRHVGGGWRDAAGRQASGSVGGDDPTGGKSCSVMHTRGGRIGRDVVGR